MDAQKRARLDFWIELTAVIVVGTLLIGALAYSKSKPLTADDIAIEAGDLRSLSAAGSLLAQEFSDGQVTDTFFEEQLELTKDKVDTARETLETSDIDEEVRSDAERVKQLGNRVGAAFDSLSTDATAISRSGSELRDLSVTLKALEENLKKEAEK